MEAVKDDTIKANKVMVGDKNNTDMSKSIKETEKGERWTVMLGRKDVINMIRGVKPSNKLTKEELDKLTIRMGGKLKWRHPVQMNNITLNQLAGVYLKCR